MFVLQFIIGPRHFMGTRCTLHKSHRVHLSSERLSRSLFSFLESSGHHFLMMVWTQCKPTITCLEKKKKRKKKGTIFQHQHVESVIWKSFVTRENSCSDISEQEVLQFNQIRRNIREQSLSESSTFETVVHARTQRIGRELVSSGGFLWFH